MKLYLLGQNIATAVICNLCFSEERVSAPYLSGGIFVNCAYIQTVLIVSD